MPGGTGLDTVSVYDGAIVYSGTAPSYVTGLGGDQALSLTGGSGQYVTLPDDPAGPLDVAAGSPFTFECYITSSPACPPPAPRSWRNGTRPGCWASPTPATSPSPSRA